jgi:hypothetical protein
MSANPYYDHELQMLIRENENCHLRIQKLSDQLYKVNEENRELRAKIDLLSKLVGKSPDDLRDVK